MLITLLIFNYSLLVIHCLLVFPADTQYFFQRSYALKNKAAAVLSQCGSKRACILFHGVFAFTVVDHILQFVIDRHKFINTGTPCVAQVITLVTA